MQPLIIAIACLAIALFLYVPLPHIVCKAMLARQRRAAVSRKTAYLTFDDGPGNRLTPLILDILDANSVKATFFSLGRNIPGREGLLSRIAERGHLVATHGYGHPNAWKTPPWTSPGDIAKGRSLLRGALPGTGRILYRPPHGKVNLPSLLYLLFHGIPIVLWSVDSLDSRLAAGRDPGSAGEALRREGGGIVLFHDFDRSTEAAESFTLEALVSAIKGCKAAGIAFGRADELFR